MPDRIGLCFSGGGLRATFFHLGVIKALRARGLLSRVTHIYSVSGGSILAAHLVLNWSQYNGSDADFGRMEQKLRALGSRDLRGRIVRRWLLSLSTLLPRLFSSKFRRTGLLEREYARLYHGASLADLGKAGQPDLHILTTSLTTGSLCSFSREGFWIDDGAEAKLIPNTILPVSLAVAASSAFPPLFPPVPITRRRLDASEGDMPLDTDYLSDGGVFDNLGFEKFARMKFADEVQPHWLILSDAGASFDWDVKRRFSWIVSRTVRATDILMKRLDERILATTAGGRSRTLHVPIAWRRDERPGVLPVDLRKRIAKIRTDLDIFSPLEIQLLIRRGYERCDAALRDHLPATAPDTAHHWPPYDGVSTLTDVRRLDRSDVRSIGIFNIRDWASYVLVGWVLLLIAAWPAFLALRSATVAQQTAEADALLRQANMAIEEATTVTPPGPTPPPDPTTRVQRSNYGVLVQFAGVIKREEMTAMMAQLVTAGWRILGDRRGARESAAAGLNEIRYSGDDERAATLLAEEVGKELKTTRPIRAVRVPRVVPGTLEVWVSR